MKLHFLAFLSVGSGPPGLAACARLTGKQVAAVLLRRGLTAATLGLLSAARGRQPTLHGPLICKLSAGGCGARGRAAGRGPAVGGRLAAAVQPAGHHRPDNK